MPRLRSTVAFVATALLVVGCSGQHPAPTNATTRGGSPVTQGAGLATTRGASPGPATISFDCDDAGARVCWPLLSYEAARVGMGHGPIEAMRVLAGGASTCPGACPSGVPPVQAFEVQVSYVGRHVFAVARLQRYANGTIEPLASGPPITPAVGPGPDRLDCGPYVSAQLDCLREVASTSAWLAPGGPLVTAISITRPTEWNCPSSERSCARTVDQMSFWFQGLPASTIVLTTDPSSPGWVPAGT